MGGNIPRMQEVQLPLSLWDRGKESCGNARKLGLLQKGQGTLEWEKKPPVVPATAPVLGREPRGHTSAELCGGECSQHRAGTARCQPSIGVPALPVCPPRATLRCQPAGPRAALLTGGLERNKAQRSLLIFKLSA